MHAGEYPWQEFDKRLQASQTVAALTSEALGDRINLQDGTLSFQATDIELPSHHGPRVAFSRSYRTYNRTLRDLYQDGPEFRLGDWQVELPNLSGTFLPDWVAPGNPLQRCSDTRPPPLPVSNFSYFLSDFYHGVQLHIPGVGGGELLVTRPGVMRPNDGYTYRWMTNDQIHVRCLPAVQNTSGEGFLAVTPDGTRYWFDWMAQYPMTNLVKKEWGHQTGRYVSEVRPRKLNVLYATRVEDRFGNWVTYRYTNASSAPARLAEILASDGRRLTFDYNSAGRIIRVNAHGRTWHYHYVTTGRGRTSLQRVVQPDGSAWTINLGAFTDAIIDYAQKFHPLEPVRDCFSLEVPRNWGTQFVGSLTHPSGVTGAFTLGIVEHGRSNGEIPESGVRT